MAVYRDRVYGARGIVTGLYGILQGQNLWCKGNCNSFVWQFTRIIYCSGVIVTSLYDSLQGQSL